MINGSARGSLWFALAAALIGFAGCSSDSDKPASDSPSGGKDDDEGAAGDGNAGDDGAAGDGNADDGTTPELALCKKYYKTVCRQAYECLTAAQRAATGFNFGTSEEDCEDALATDTPCKEITTCSEGGFSIDKANECIDGMGSLTCDEIAGGAETEACNAVCPPTANAGTESSCKKLFHAECVQIFACFPPDQSETFGANVAECEKTLAAELDCNCDTGQKFNEAQANACADDTQAQTCEAFASSSAPTSCGTICQ